MKQDGNRISAVVNTYNAEKNLDEVLSHLKGFDEIVVCDMESTDSTLGIARRHGCRIVTFPRGEHRICEPARNTAIQAATSEWVLVVDDDELVTDELRDYLYRRVEKGDCPEALNLPMVNRYMGRFSKASPDYHIRFFRRDKANWPPTIHSIVEIDGKIEKVSSRLKGVHLLHLADSSMTESVGKINRYTDQELIRRKGKEWKTGALLTRPVWFFIKSYVMKRGYRDGRRGLIRAMMQAFYQAVLVSKVNEYRWDNGTDKD